MGEAREVMDRLYQALVSKDIKAVANCYAENVVAMTPEQGEIKGRDGLLAYFQGFFDGLSDVGFEYIGKHESGNVAVDEGYITGTNTGPLPGAAGESVPATGRKIKVRTCDVTVVEGGVVTQHRFYSDQTEFLEQLGLTP
ncbi:MAG: ester cyclase [Micromonosporaceae bacterium]